MAGALCAQQVQYNFQHITAANGLNNESVSGITQDKYGFMWFGSSNGLYRYDGINMKWYHHQQDDSTSLINNFILELFTDSKNRLWIGEYPGFCMYNYADNNFIQYKDAAAVYSIAEDKQGRIWTATSRGLRISDTVHKILIAPAYPIFDTALSKIINSSIRDLCAGADNKLYAATSYGVLIIDPVTFKWDLINTKKYAPLVNSNDVRALTVDKNNRLWFSTDPSFSTLYRINENKEITRYNYFQQPDGKGLPSSILKIFADNKNRIWVGSTYLGISLYNEATNSFTSSTNDPAISNSIAANFCNAIYQANDGLIWVSAIGAGVDFFHPDKMKFSSITRNPFIELSLLDNWGRAVAEDDHGNLWLGTGNGVSLYDFKKGVIRNFTNTNKAKKELHSQSVRSLLNGGDGTVWIGTADGLNRFNTKTGEMLFYGTKDSLPYMFVHSLIKLKNGNVLIGGNGGLFEYDHKKDKFINCYKFYTALKPFANNVIKCIEEDNNGKWWLGTFRNGVIVYNPAKDEIAATMDPANKSKLSNGFINSISEDDHGNMWIGTVEGLNYYNQQTGINTVYSSKDGLPNSWICGLKIDKQGRIWIGTGNGLCVMSKERKILKVFDMADGLSSSYFNDQAAFRLSDGHFVFPSRKGFVVFDPNEYKPAETPPLVYINAIKVSDKPVASAINEEELKELHLKHDENFFSIELTSLNYYNPNQCWIAYKLDGFDKDWVYSKGKNINYTNVPGGKYVFRYKVSNSQTNWTVPEKEMTIFIGTVFYKQWWFISMMILISVLIFFGFYRYRLSQREKLLLLQNKAQLLEKEKALVMYEGLKQQLNPHFLFNSLTSLNSLINTAPADASRFLDSLSKTYRYILKSRDSETIPLAEEIKFAENYIGLQKTRFEKGLELNLNVPEEFRHRKIVPVTLQNLIENALKHNIIDEESPLVIDIYVEDNYLVVKNNVQKKKFVETSNKQGLSNMQSLYRHLNNVPMEIQETPTLFTIKIPLL